MFDAATDTAFLRSIIDSPDDDAPRLVYADWLDEHGDADRAEFIRLQVRLSRMPADDPERAGVTSRALELKQQHLVEWINLLPQFKDVHWVLIDRGFMSAARFDHPDAFFEHAREVFEAAPVCEVRLHQFRWVEASRLAGSRHLRRVRVLDLNDGNRIGNQGLEALMGSPYLSRLTELKVGGNSLGSAGVRAVALAESVGRLRLLKLERNDLFDEALTYLAGSANMAHLEVLDMSRTRTGDDAVRALARTRHLTRLQWLDLSNNPLTDEGLVPLVSSGVLAEVRDLFLYRTSISDAGVEALAASSHSAGLERLFLREAQIRDAGALALARSPHLGRLRELHLGGNRISDLAGDELRSRFRSGVNLH